MRVCLADDPFEGPCIPLARWACRVLQASSLAWFCCAAPPVLCLPGCRGVQSAFLAQARQSLVSLPLSALVPEPRSGVRREAATWPSYGVACVMCFCGSSVSPFVGAEAGARLARRGRRRCVPLLAASGGGLVAVVVTVLLCPSCTTVVAWPWLAPVGVVGLALGRPVLLVVPARFPLSTVAPFLGVSLQWHRHVWLPDLVACPRSRVVLLVGPRPCRVPTALAGEGLVIPTGPCSQGSPPLLPSTRGSSSRELGVGRVAETAVAPCCCRKQ
ncbi:hypothetical protein Taro_023600 [Colocasia esculenta]|uniref:Uncharacterized protein n=1 Tax=Colocasia esculenta TaxID=4460 RepID=A0A843UXU9_COLES|nr:hypothetical protein [Colocasia esculenta]